MRQDVRGGRDRGASALDEMSNETQKPRSGLVIRRRTPSDDGRSPAREKQEWGRKRILDEMGDKRQTRNAPAVSLIQ